MGWDTLPGSLARGRATRDERFFLRPRRPSSVTDCPLEKESVPTSHGTWKYVPCQGLGAPP